MSHKVFIASSVGAGKEYALPLLKKFYAREAGDLDTFLTIVDGAKVEEKLQGDTIYLPEPKAKLNRVGRIARVREIIRQEFLKSDCEYLYWHDCDMVPEKGIIDRLLQIGLPIVSGLYLCRTYREALAPIMVEIGQGATATTLVNSSILASVPHEVLGVGFGCLLMERNIAEKVSFRDPKWYEKNLASEDYQYCLDAQNVAGKPVIDAKETVWHVDADGTGLLPVIGEPAYSVVYVGHAQQITNRYGAWYRGVPRTDITEEQAQTLNYEFDCREMASVSIERKQFL